MKELLIYSLITIAALGNMPKGTLGADRTDNDIQEEKYVELQSRMDTISTQNFELQSKMDTISTQNFELQSKMDTISTQNFELQSKMDTISTQNFELQSKYYNLSAQNLELMSTYGTLASKYQTLESEILKYVYKHDTEKLVAIYDNLSAQNKELASKYDILAAQSLQLENYIRELHKDEVGLIPFPSIDDKEFKPASCEDVKKYDNKNGPHTLFLSDNKTVKVYCDQTIDKGGWIFEDSKKVYHLNTSWQVIQRRQDGSVNFYRDWEQYEIGFGNLKTEFWIGLINLHYLTKSQTFRLLVELTDFGGSKAYAHYNTFSISGFEDGYQINVDEYSGTAGDSLGYSNKRKFSTYDMDNDNNVSGNCAELRQGAWWYGNCALSNLNGRYDTSGSLDDEDGLNWYTQKCDWRSFKHAEMKIKLRPLN